MFSTQFHLTRHASVRTTWILTCHITTFVFCCLRIHLVRIRNILLHRRIILLLLRRIPRSLVLLIISLSHRLRRFNRPLWRSIILSIILTNLRSKHRTVITILRVLFWSDRNLIASTAKLYTIVIRKQVLMRHF